MSLLEKGLLRAVKKWQFDTFTQCNLYFFSTVFYIKFFFSTVFYIKYDVFALPILVIGNLESVNTVPLCQH